MEQHNMINLDDPEIRAAHLQGRCEALTQIVARQEAEIARLRRQLEEWERAWRAK